MIEVVNGMGRVCRCESDIINVFGNLPGYIQIYLIVVNTIGHILDSVSLLLFDDSVCLLGGDDVGCSRSCCKGTNSDGCCNYDGA